MLDTIQSEKYLSLRKKIIEKYFGRMNEMQLSAVVNTEGPVLILAGAGSGKTTVLVNRIANMVKFGNSHQSTYIPPFISENDITYMENYLENGGDETTINELVAVNHINPWNILAITFTNKAANELRDRLEKMLGDSALDIKASTFHSACVRILRIEGEALGYGKSFTIYDTDDSVKVIKETLKSDRKSTRLNSSHL